MINIIYYTHTQTHTEVYSCTTRKKQAHQHIKIHTHTKIHTHRHLESVEYFIIKRETKNLRLHTSKRKSWAWRLVGQHLWLRHTNGRTDPIPQSTPFDTQLCQHAAYTPERPYQAAANGTLLILGHLCLCLHPCLPCCLRTPAPSDISNDLDTSSRVTPHSGQRNRNTDATNRIM